MNKKVKRILSIIALVFMTVFTVTFIIWLTAPKLLNGQFGYWAMFSGSTGIAIFLIIKFIKTPQEKEEEAKKLQASYLPPPEISDKTAKSPESEINAAADNKSADNKTSTGDESENKKTD